MRTNLRNQIAGILSAMLCSATFAQYNPAPTPAPGSRHNSQKITQIVAPDRIDPNLTGNVRPCYFIYMQPANFYATIPTVSSNVNAKDHKRIADMALLLDRTVDVLLLGNETCGGFPVVNTLVLY